MVALPGDHGSIPSTCTAAQDRMKKKQEVGKDTTASGYGGGFSVDKGERAWTEAGPSERVQSEHDPRLGHVRRVGREEKRGKPDQREAGVI